MDITTISPERICYKGDWMERLEGRWAAFYDTFDWRWKYERGWISPSFFKIYNVKITEPNRPDKTMRANLQVYVSDGFDQEKVVAADTIARCGGFALIVGTIPHGSNKSEILKNLKRKTVMDIDTRYREYWFFAPDDWKDEFCNSVQSLLWVDDDGQPVVGTWHTKEGRSDGNIQKTLLAFDHARQSRFEWGQNGYQ